MKINFNKIIYWAPRILAILFILFLAMFSLDVFDLQLDFWQTIVGLLMHNIPVLILLIVLIISWKYEIVGGIAFILAGLLYIVFLAVNSIINGFEWYYLTWPLPISGPAILIGILFLINWRIKKINNYKLKPTI